jgi:hypothetical protein
MQGWIAQGWTAEASNARSGISVLFDRQPVNNGDYARMAALPDRPWNRPGSRDVG